MAHPEQSHFVRSVATCFPSYFHGSTVLEIGSRNINGTVRELFTDCQYTGLDCTPGDCVDVVALAHEWGSPTLFDVVISCEAFEHDPYFVQTIDMAMRQLAPRGLFVATWASPSRAEHGTKRTGDVYGPCESWYCGIGPKEFLDAIDGRLEPISVVVSDNGQDVYAVGWRTY